MTPAMLRELLNAVATGELSVDDAFVNLRNFPTDNLGFARIDTHRTVRTGIPEVIYGAGKTEEQVVTIAERLASTGSPVLITRIEASVAKAVSRSINNTEYHPIASMLTAPGHEPVERRGRIAVVSAGTSDQSVAEEAAVTANTLGVDVKRVYDAGVAALHRVLESRAVLDQSDVIIVVAGMEGALPSVVGGLTDKPVIGVPTSVGYGAALNGLTPMLSMLTGCAPGVSVVNIDNGFGAGVQATLIARRAERSAS